MKTIVVIGLMALLPAVVQAETVLSVDAAAQVTGTGFTTQYDGGIANTLNNAFQGPAVAEGQVASDTTTTNNAPSVYVAASRPDFTGNFGMGNGSASGWRIRINTVTNATRFFSDNLFCVDNVSFATGNDTLDASNIRISNMAVITNGTIRFVVRDNGNFYISDPSPNFQTIQSTGTLVTAYSTTASSTTWYDYDPTTAPTVNGVADIGGTATPAFDNIDFIGFHLEVTTTADTSGCNFGVVQFSATAVSQSTTIISSPLEAWKFWDTANTEFSSTYNSGSLGSEWNFGGTDWSTDGSGNLVFDNTDGQTIRKLPDTNGPNAEPTVYQYSSPITSGVHRLEINYSSWNLDPTQVTAGHMGFEAYDQDSGGPIAGFRLKVGSPVAGDAAREYFTFETDTAGSSFGTNWDNSGSLGSEWNFGGPGTMAANGSGQMVVSNHNGQTFRRLPKAGTANADAGADQYATPFTTGAYRLELDFDSWSLDGTAALNGDITLQLRPSAASGSVVGIRLKLQDASTARVQLFSDLAAAGSQNGFRNFDFPLTDLSSQSFAIEFDFDNDTVDYYQNGSVTHSFTDFSATQLGTVQFSSTSSWDTNHVVSIEQMGLVEVGVGTVTPANLQLISQESGVLNFNNNDSFGITQSSPVEAAIEFDFDNDTADYYVDGVNVASLTSFDASQLGQLRFYSNADWRSNSTVSVSGMSLSGIDEIILAVDFDGTEITNSLQLEFGQLFPVSLIDPKAAPTNDPGIAGTTGEIIYGGFEPDPINILFPTTNTASMAWAAHNNEGAQHGGIRLQWNGTPGGDDTGLYEDGDLSYGVAIWKKEDFLNGLDATNVALNAANDTLSAGVAFLPAGASKDGTNRLESASFRWLVQDAGQFYLSSATVYTNETAEFEEPLSSEATELSWFTYDPLSSIKTVGSAASPTLQNIEALGFWMSAEVATNNGVRRFPNFRVNSFSARAAGTAAAATPATLSIVDNGDGTVTVSWDTSGTLQSAPTVDGTYTDVAGSPTSPYISPAAGSETYYRVVD